MSCICICVYLTLLSPLLVVFILRRFLRVRRNTFRSQISDEKNKVVAFFHPFCNAGGGGERVLWAAIDSLYSRFPQHYYVIYTDSYDVDDEEILRKAKRTFQIETDNFRIQFIRLKTCFFLSSKLYPVFTILFQNLGAMAVGLEAVIRCPPHVLIDTMGCSFIFPIFKLLASPKICAYVHYPTVSVDMLKQVASNQASFNNRKLIARYPLLGKIKLLYYNIFAHIYKLTGRCADVIMVNSSWTNNHIQQIWNVDVRTVYPPCNTSHLKRLNLSAKDKNLIISMAQFRPEKNHRLQIEAFAKLIQLLRENGKPITVKLVIIGSCRNGDDNRLVDDLRKTCRDLDVEQHIEFRVNLPYVQMEKLLEEASIAIHTMINEHFGISVVEFLAAGLLTLSHNSGGPKLDIIQENVTGFFASNVIEFANALYELVNLSESKAMKIRIDARESVDKFSEETFDRSFGEMVTQLL